MHHGVSAMTLRVILVGLVAGLGLGLPSAERVRTWGDSARDWARTQLAEFEARTATDEGAFVLLTEPTADDAEAATSETPAEPTPATATAAAASPASPAVTPTE